MSFSSAMTGARPDYHFEEAATREELDTRTPFLVEKGWKPVGSPRQIQLNFPSGRQEMRFSQAFVRPALLPVCQRIGQSLPPAFSILTGPVKPCEHLVHFYDEESVLLNSLETFILHGLMAGEGVVVIALPGHRTSLEFRLAGHGLNLDKLVRSEQLVMLDAETTLASFMHAGMPSEMLFEEKLGGLLNRVRAHHHTVRAFGEMVGILWQQGNKAATLRLEKLWHAYCSRERLMLYCAYPRAAFASEREALEKICATHSRVIEA
jgi:hypothetical protein